MKLLINYVFHQYFNTYANKKWHKNGFSDTVLPHHPPKKPKKIPSRYCTHSTIGNKQIEYSLILLIFYQPQTLTQAPFHLCEYLKSHREKHNEYLLLK